MFNRQVVDDHDVVHNYQYDVSRWRTREAVRFLDHLKAAHQPRLRPDLHDCDGCINLLAEAEYFAKR
jgi:hypothetical protein